MRIAGMITESVVDGPGVRFVLFTQGCPHECAYCHNPESWSINGGTEITVRQVIRIIKRKAKKIRGVTFSGGEPFLQCRELVEIAKEVHNIGLDIVTYTGYTYEYLRKCKNQDVQELLKMSDILVDGPYVHSLRDISLRFRGSSNQRVIDIEKTEKIGAVTLFS